MEIFVHAPLRHSWVTSHGVENRPSRDPPGQTVRCYVTREKPASDHIRGTQAWSVHARELAQTALASSTLPFGSGTIPATANEFSYFQLLK